jgi:prevent-host-death family protein
MRGVVLMPRTVSSSEAKAKFGELVKWTTKEYDEVIVKLYGEPAVVMMPFSKFEEMKKLRKREQKRKVLEALEELRQEARRQNPDLTAEEAYRLAGFSEEVIQDTLDKVRELAAKQQ